MPSPNKILLRASGRRQFLDLTAEKAKRNYAENVSEYNTVLTSLNTRRRIRMEFSIKYIRGLAWPAVVVGWVAQSASLGMKDSWGPLKALAVASAINGIGDVGLCMYLGYGIAGAAWATMVSLVVAAYMMIDALNKKGYNAFVISIPSFNELLIVLAIAGPVVVTLMSKFSTLLIYFATSMGTHTVPAHQVMLQIFAMCGVLGEPLSKTAVIYARVDIWSRSKFAKGWLPQLWFYASSALISRMESFILDAVP
ncbi:MATE efflux family protein 4 isoform 3 [Hibiscus syriacus]|uniref:MATE efflux family protein 4 isoform 3 n=1 Tax=Hibiscus syriacus TaxID=106335 RepID=A0A6A2YW29_HIBSY|nr:MATE efflux family protein 4 isoform 3 [Hibiscus syriacus]